MNSRPFGSAAALLLLALVAGLVAAPPTVTPAAAATLAPGDTLYGISCDWVPDDGGHQLFGLDATTAVGYAIGNDATELPYFCALSTVWAGGSDECAAYTVARDPDDSRALFRTDLLTGLSTRVGGFTDGGVPTKVSSVAHDGAGQWWALGADRLYRVDVVTGALTLAGMVPGYLTGLVWSPTEDVFFATGGEGVYTIDPVGVTAGLVFAGATVSGGPIGLMEGITVDSTGVVWVSERENNPDAESPNDWTYALWSVAPGGAAERHGRILVDGVKLGTAALLALPPTADCGQLPTLPLPEPDPGVPTQAALAATGSESPMMLVVIVGGVTALGAALLVLASRRRPREPGRS